MDVVFIFSDQPIIAYFTAGSSRDGEPTMPDAFLDSKHEIVDDWRHVDTVGFVQKRLCPVAWESVYKGI